MSQNVKAHELEVGDEIVSPNGKAYTIVGFAWTDKVGVIIVNAVTHSVYGYDTKRFEFGVKDKVPIKG